MLDQNGGAAGAPGSPSASGGGSTTTSAIGGGGNNDPARPLTAEELGQLTKRAAESIEQAKADVLKVVQGVMNVAQTIETYGEGLIKALDGSATGLTSQVEAYATRAIEAGRIIEQAKGKATGK